MIKFEKLKLLRLILFFLGSALIVGGVVSFFSYREIQKWQDVAAVLQARIISLEMRLKEAGSPELNGFVSIDKDKYVGGAEVTGYFYLSGEDKDICFSPDDESVKILPEFKTVPVFCLMREDASKYDKVVEELFGKTANEVYENRIYSIVDPNRTATIKIQDYEIREFKKTQVRTGYTNLVEVVKK